MLACLGKESYSNSIERVFVQSSKNESEHFLFIMSCD